MEGEERGRAGPRKSLQEQHLPLDPQCQSISAGPRSKLPVPPKETFGSWEQKEVSNSPSSWWGDETWAGSLEPGGFYMALWDCLEKLSQCGSNPNWHRGGFAPALLLPWL